MGPCRDLSPTCCMPCRHEAMKGEKQGTVFVSASLTCTHTSSLTHSLTHRPACHVFLEGNGDGGRDAVLLHVPLHGIHSLAVLHLLSVSVGL